MSYIEARLAYDAAYDAHEAAKIAHMACKITSEEYFVVREAFDAALADLDIAQESATDAEIAAYYGDTVEEVSEKPTETQMDLF